MKYESNILKRLIDTYGVVGNPRYISEIIKEFIVQGKERFPNLFTYQADWLAHIDEFGLNPSYAVSYTGQSIYAPNTLERPVKSAILKGQTLVNLSENLQTITFTLSEWYNNVKLMNNIEKLKRNTYYTILYRLENLSGNHQHYNGISLGIGMNAFNKDILDNINSIVDKNGGWCKVRFQLTDDFIEQNPTYKHLYIRPIRRGIAPVEGESINYTIRGFAILEGDYITNPIPFNEVFEGMQSVKLPVITTTGKNVFNINAYTSLKNNTTIEGEWLILWENYQTSGSTWDVTLAPNTSYYVSDFIDSDITTNNSSGRFRVVDKMGNEILKLGGFNRLLTTTNESDYIFEIGRGSSFVGSITKFKIQIEQGTVATSYEPYKTNILSTSKDVELRGIGDVKDTLDLTTGELTQRIGEVVLDGSEDWATHSYGYCLSASHLGIYHRTTSNEQVANNFVADSVPTVSIQNLSALTIDGIAPSHRRYKEILLFVKEVGKSNLNGLKQWLSQNPITVQYELATESIKTVDLNILDQNGQNIKQLMSFNGGTHFNTGSAEGSPLPVLSVSVETDLEETLRVCSLEGNTM